MTANLELDSKPYYSTRTAATLLNVSLGTVQKMVERGELGAWKTNGGHRRILKETVHNLLALRAGKETPVEHAHELDLVVFHPNHQEAQRIQAQLARWGLPLKSTVVDDVIDAVIATVSTHPRVVLYYLEEFDDSELGRVEKLQQFFSSRNVVFAAIASRQSYEHVAQALKPLGTEVFLKTPTLDEIKGFLRAQLMMSHRLNG